jgi:hypothetical protein
MPVAQARNEAHPAPGEPEPERPDGTTMVIGGSLSSSTAVVSGSSNLDVVLSSFGT